LINKDFSSNLKISSNLCIVEGYPSNDKRYLSQIHDFKLLERLNNNPNSRYNKKNGFTKLQIAEYEKISIHCVYAKKKDYPFGTNHEGKVICKCLNEQCKYFSNCRENGLSEKERSLLLKNEKQVHVRPIITINNYNLQKSYEYSFIIYENIDKIEEKSTDKVKEKSTDKVKENNKNIDILKNAEGSNSKQRKNKKSIFQLKNQEYIIKKGIEERVVINAGPGTGKTYSLIQRIKYLITNQELNSNEMIILCFSRAAVSEIKKE